MDGRSIAGLRPPAQIVAVAVSGSVPTGQALAFFKMSWSRGAAADASPGRRRLGRAVPVALHGLHAIGVDLNDGHGAEVELSASGAAVAAAHAHGAFGLAAHRQASCAAGAGCMRSR